MRNTLQHYESGRNIKPTDFNPPHLKDYRIDRYLVETSTAKNKHLKSEMTEYEVAESEKAKWVQIAKRYA